MKAPIHSIFAAACLWVSAAGFAPAQTPLSVAQNLLNPTAPVTATYAATPGQLVDVDASGGSLVFTLPTAPADGSRLAYKIVAISGTNTVTVNCGAGDALNKTGGSTSLVLSTPFQRADFQYHTGVWSVTESLALPSLDARFATAAQGAKAATALQPTAVNTTVQAFSAVTVAGADVSGVIDATAVFQAAHDSLPAAGGEIIIPPGKYLINGTVNVSKCARFVGAGGDSISHQYGTVLVTTNTNGGAGGCMFNVTVDSCSFADLNFLNPNALTTNTAGAFIVFGAAYQMHMDRCNFNGNWGQVQILNGHGWTLFGCVFQSPAKYGIEISHQTSVDDGDNCLTACQWDGGGQPPGAIGIHYLSGGGLKVVSCKLNGPLNGIVGTPGVPGVTYGYSYGIWIDVGATIASSDTLISSNSFENVYLHAIYASFQTNSGQWGHITITSNQFALMSTNAIMIGDYPASQSSSNVNFAYTLIAGNIFHQCPSAIIMKAAATGVIGTNHFAEDTVHPIQLTADCLGFTVEPQTRVGVGYIAENLGSSNTIIGRAMLTGQYTSGSTPTVLFRIGVPPNGGGSLEVTAGGLINGTGIFSLVQSRAFCFNPGLTNVSIATVGTDTGASASSAYTGAFDVTTTPGEIRVTGVGASGAACFGNVRLDTQGAISYLKVGP